MDKTRFLTLAFLNQVQCTKAKRMILTVSMSVSMMDLQICRYF